jgi:hypothetical protein
MRRKRSAVWIAPAGRLTICPLAVRNVNATLAQKFCDFAGREIWVRAALHGEVIDDDFALIQIAAGGDTNVVRTRGKKSAACSRPAYFLRAAARFFLRLGFD